MSVLGARFLSLDEKETDERGEENEDETRPNVAQEREARWVAGSNSVKGYHEMKGRGRG